MTKRISDESVIKATGKSWNEWYSILNKAGAKKMEHKDIAEYLSTKLDERTWFYRGGAGLFWRLAPVSGDAGRAAF